jgi:hypothetical protein
MQSQNWRVSGLGRIHLGGLVGRMSFEGSFFGSLGMRLRFAQEASEWSLDMYLKYADHKVALF